MRHGIVQAFLSFFERKCPKQICRFLCNYFLRTFQQKKEGCMHDKSKRREGCREMKMKKTPPACRTGLRCTRIYSHLVTTLSRQWSLPAALRYVQNLAERVEDGPPCCAIDFEKHEKIVPPAASK